MLEQIYKDYPEIYSKENIDKVKSLSTDLLITELNIRGINLDITKEFKIPLDDFEAILKAPNNLIIYGINTEDIKNVYFNNPKTISRLKKYSPDYLKKVEYIIDKLKSNFKENK